MKLRDFKIDNDEKMTLMGGMNVLESRDLAMEVAEKFKNVTDNCLLYTSPSPRDLSSSRMPSSA